MHARVRYAGTTLAIESQGAAAERVARVLFARLDRGDDAAICKTLTLVQEDAGAAAEILVDGVQVRTVQGNGALAEFALSEAAYHLIDGCREGLVVHAGVVSRDGRGALLPAQSGSGKSTLTAWLVARGYAHVSDELGHLIAPEREVAGFRRPIELKPGGRAIIEPLIRGERSDDTWLETREGCMLDPRLLGESVSSTLLHALVFPTFAGADAKLELTPLSQAQAAARLMGNVLNARNLAGHGLPVCATWARALPAFALRYPSFDGVESVLERVLSRSRA